MKAHFPTKTSDLNSGDDSVQALKEENSRLRTAILQYLIPLADRQQAHQRLRKVVGLE